MYSKKYFKVVGIAAIALFIIASLVYCPYISNKIHIVLKKLYDNQLFLDIFYVIIGIMHFLSCLVLIASVILQRGEEGAFAKAANMNKKTDSNAAWSVTVSATGFLCVSSIALNLLIFALYKKPFAI